MSDSEEITQLLLHERQTRDRGWWDRMAACYHADSHVETSWFSGTGAEFVERSRTSGPSGPVGTHRLSPPVIHVNADRAVVELPMALEVRAVINHVAGLYRAAFDWLDGTEAASANEPEGPPTP